MKQCTMNCYPRSALGCPECIDVEPSQRTLALEEWLDKTEWVQKEIKTFPVSALGKHRADVMREEIMRLRELEVDARRYRLLISLIRYAATDTPHEELPEVERAVVDICGPHTQDIDALVAAIDDVLARFPNG